ncbi:MAG: hypothetical protein AAF846_14750 [Chloroflexota bacterium]
MQYTLQGLIRGLLCNTLQVVEYPTDSLIRVYRPNPSDDLQGRINANPKQTLAVLSDEALSNRRSNLLAEARVDDEGRFSIVMDDAQVKYDGGALDIDLYLERVPNQKDEGASSSPVQVHITTIQPKWRETNNGATSVFNYTFSEASWCALRRRFGAWVILGRVGICENGRVTQGVPNLSITAFDQDWLQDDTLGNATSDGNGFFRIDYMEEDFKQTFLSPFINVETLGPAGPDVYFNVTDGSTTLLQESDSDVRDDVSPCLCVELCVNLDSLGDFPYFTSYGDIPIDAVHGALDQTTGLVTQTVETAGTVRGIAGDGFHSIIELGGYIPDTHPDTGRPTRYRFMYVISDTQTTPNQQIKGSIVRNTVVSQLIVNPSDPISTPLQPIEVRTTAPTTPLTDRTIVVQDQVDGWIDVIANTIHSGYANPLLAIDTRQIISGGNPSSVGLNGQRIWLQMQFEDIDGNGRITSPIYPMYINNWSEFAQLSLGVDLCSELSGDLPLTYSVDHELLQNWAISISTVASGFVSPALPSGNAPRGGNGTVTLQTSTWSPCVYHIRLTGRRQVTTGLQRDDSDTLRSLSVYINNSGS